MSPNATPTRAAQELTTRVDGGVGQTARRPDATLKVKGEFAFSSDLWAEGMLWGATLRSPYPRARIIDIDVSRAVAMPGVFAVLTHDDVPGAKCFGLEVADQPVLAIDQVRYQGEAVAIIAADDPETARRAADNVVVRYECQDPIVDAVAALADDSDAVNPAGNVVRHQRVRSGDGEQATAPVVVRGEYEIGMQDQAFLGTESGLAVPADDGGVDFYVATQNVHDDRRQVAACLGLGEDMVRMTIVGVGGAFGAREDISMEVHAGLLALRTGRPVKFVYSREESFFGHVHRHPARMAYEHGATPDGKLVYVKARIVLDGGAYASTTAGVVGNAAAFATGPYRVPHVAVDAWGVYTNNPPCGAMRGFGAVQPCFAYASQMDRLAAELGLDPVEIRVRNAVSEGDVLPTTHQLIDSPAPASELLRRVRDLPLPPVTDGPRNPIELPGGAGNTTRGEGVVRGVGYGIGIKNVGYGEGVDDYSTARVRLEVIGGEPTVLVHTAAAEMGQGIVTIQQQTARTELGVEKVTIHPADTSVGSAGSSSASRQTYVTGGAVKAACEQIREALFRRLPDAVRGAGRLRLEGGKLFTPDDEAIADLRDVIGDEPIERTVEWRHRPTEEPDANTGRGNAHVQWGLCAHRAVVDVDVELGLVKVVELAAAEDVGRIMNPQGVEGQIEGGSAQGLGLALLEEIQVTDGRVQNASFTDYLIPTILDMPPMRLDVLEMADPHAPYGLRGVGEPATISSTPAVVAAVRAATGVPLKRVPIRPEHITGQEVRTAGNPRDA